LTAVDGSSPFEPDGVFAMFLFLFIYFFKQTKPLTFPLLFDPNLIGDAIFSGPEDLGPGTWGSGDRDQGPSYLDLNNWHTLYVYIHSTYIIHVSLIARLECTMEQTKKFGVQ